MKGYNSNDLSGKSFGVFIKRLLRRGGYIIWLYYKGLTVIVFFLAAHLGWICITATTCNRVFSFRLPEHARCWQNSTSTLQITVLMYSLHLCRSSSFCKRTVITLRETHQVKVMFRNCYPVYSSVGRSAEQEDVGSNPS